MDRDQAGFGRAVCGEASIGLSRVTARRVRDAQIELTREGLRHRSSPTPREVAAISHPAPMIEPARSRGSIALRDRAVHPSFVGHDFGGPGNARASAAPLRLLVLGRRP